MWRLCHAACGRRTAVRAKRAPVCASGQVEDVAGAGAPADGPEAVLDGVAGDLLGGSGRLERAVAERQVGGQGRRVRAARPVRRTVRVALPGDQADRIAIDRFATVLISASRRD